MGLKWIEVFKAGTRTSGNGLTRNYSTEELDQVVETYNPDTFKAPLIVSYPAHNTAGHSDGELHKSQLAFGFPEKLQRIGDRLLAGFSKISPKVKEWIGNGEILGFSSSFYLPDSPWNPYPGKLSLRHIAGCGVDPPAVKGMAPPELAEPLTAFANYSEEQEGSVEFSLDADPETIENARLGVKLYQALKSVDYSVASFMGGDGYNPTASILKDLIQRLRDRQIEESSVEDADKLFPVYLLDQLGSIATQSQSYVTWDDFRYLQNQVDQLISALSSGDASSSPMYQEGGTVPDEKYDELKAENDSLKEQVQQIQAEREKERVSSFVEGLIRDRKLLPSERDSEIRDILNLPNDSTADYGEDGELSPRQRYMNKLSGRKELWSDRRPPIDPGDAPEEFSEGDDTLVLPPDYSIDPQQAKIYRQAKAYEKEKGCSFSEAVAAVSRNGNGRH